MDLTIEQSCPSCGAPIVLHEDDKLITCEFCDVASFRLDSGAARYILPCKPSADAEKDQLLYIPYLRFKGAVYFVENDRVGYKIVDATRLAIESTRLPQSLGVRPQAMKVRPVTASLAGRFVKRTVPVKSAFMHAANLVDLFSTKMKTPPLHRAFIGETISIIYLPCYVKAEALVDGVDNSEIGPVTEVLGTGFKTVSNQKTWEPEFITTLCAACGGLLKGESDSRVLVCENCNLHYLEENGGLTRTDWGIVGCDEKNVHYFPFWRLEVKTKGIEINGFAGLVQFTNQPIIVSAQQQEMPLVFMVPAFKINPKTFLRIGSQLTIAQNRFGDIEKGRCESHPVNLDKDEAIQAVKSILANLTVGRKKSLKLLPKVGVDVQSCELSFIPFKKNVHDYIQVHTPASLQVAAVRYGRKL